MTACQARGCSKAKDATCPVSIVRISTAGLGNRGTLKCGNRSGWRAEADETENYVHAIAPKLGCERTATMGWEEEWRLLDGYAGEFANNLFNELRRQRAFIPAIRAYSYNFPKVETGLNVGASVDSVRFN